MRNAILRNYLKHLGSGNRENTRLRLVFSPTLLSCSTASCVLYNENRARKRLLYLLITLSCINSMTSRMFTNPLRIHAQRSLVMFLHAQNCEPLESSHSAGFKKKLMKAEVVWSKCFWSFVNVVCNVNKSQCQTQIVHLWLQFLALSDSMMLEVIYQKPVRVFHQGFQTKRK